MAAINGEHVAVYWNFHKKKFSVTNRTTRLVVEHAANMTLVNVTFKVSEKGRARVLRDRKKNVHAYVVGYVSHPTPKDKWSRRDMSKVPGFFQVRYNPYEHESFVTLDGTPVTEAKTVVLTKGKIFASLDDRSDHDPDGR